MTWFSALILFECRVGGILPSDGFYELSVRLVQAKDSAAALAEAESIGKEHAHEYLNGEGELVSWTFKKVVEAQELANQTLTSGSEVYSRIFGSQDSLGAHLVAPTAD